MKGVTMERAAQEMVRVARKVAPQMRRPRIITGAFLLTLSGLSPVLAPAQAPGTPISTTILEPAAPQAGDGAVEGLPDVPPAAVPENTKPDTGFSIVTGPGEDGAANIKDAVGGASALDPETGDPRDGRATRADAPQDAATSGTGKTTENIQHPDPGNSRTEIVPDPEPGEDTGISGSRDTAGTAVSVEAPSPTGPTAATATRTLLTGLWRDAVTTGETTLGFEAWLGEALGSNMGAATPKRPELPEDQAGRTRMVSERWLTRAGPVALGAAGRVVTTFGSAIPTAFCAPLMVCYIELEPGEVLTETPSIGDAARWQVVAKTQGIDPKTRVIEVKPAEDAEITNLVIPTDRRLYTINLVNDPEVHTPILSFLYPDSAARRIAEEIAAREAEEARVKAEATRAREIAAAARAAELKRSGVNTSKGTVAADRLDFGFRIDGKAPFRPVRVFADGRRTYIDLHPDYRGALPVIIAGPGEANKALNTRVAQNGTRLEADRVISDIWLQAGKKRVRIRRAGS